jgi:DNA-binding NarL/FixJ family response regulator
MCRALKVLCAAGEGRLGDLKRAAVGAVWELVGGASTEEELIRQIAEWDPDVVVIDGSLGAGAAARARRATTRARIVAVGMAAGAADSSVSSLDDVRPAVLGLPNPGGPIRSSG